MRSLIIGASGQAGGQLALRCRAEHLSWLGTAYQQPRAGLQRLDVRDAVAVGELVRGFRPDVVFLPAAMTHVDRAEERPDECRAVNVAGTANVALAVREIGGLLVFFSTEHVFPAADRAWTENDPVVPASVYAKSKVEAENAIREILPDDHLILRTSWVFGPEEQGKNFVYRAVRTLQSVQELIVPDDQYGQPTYSPDLARAAFDLCRGNHRGTFHVVGPEHLTRLDFARLIADVFELDASGIVGRSTADLRQAAPRPLHVRLSDERIRTTLGRPPIRRPHDGLLAMRQHLSVPVLA